VSLATKNKDIPYALLMGELGIGSVRELEDVIIGGIYADVFHASLDPQVLCELGIGFLGAGGALGIGGDPLLANSGLGLWSR
jgi:hypothetical protein